MADINQIPVTVVQPGEGSTSPSGFWSGVQAIQPPLTAARSLSSSHPFEVGLLTAAHRHTREDEALDCADRRNRVPL